MLFREFLAYLVAKYQSRSYDFNQDDAVLAQLNNLTDPAQFAADLAAHELAIEPANLQDSSLTHLFSNLYLSFNLKDSPAKWRDFSSYTNMVAAIVRILPPEVLHREILGGVHGLRFVDDKVSVLSYAMELLLSLYRLNFESHFEKHELYTSMIREWHEKVIQPLLDKDCSPDFGNCSKFSILTACIDQLPQPHKGLEKVYASDIIYELTMHFIQKTQAINKADSRGINAIAMAAIRNPTTDFLALLIKQGADINTCFKLSMHDTAKQPIVCLLVEKKKYSLLQFFLKQGANPNLAPAEDQYSRLFVDRRKNETWLSAYQLAIAKEDEEAIALIYQASLEHGYELNGDLMPIEKERDNWDLQNSALKIQGTRLEIQCKSRLFALKNNMLEDIFNDHGIRCVVSHQEDRSKVTNAISWFVQNGSNGSGAYFLHVALKTIIAECQTNPKFRIYFSGTLQEVYKHKPFAGELVNDTILIERGLPSRMMIETLVHEIGHFIDTKILRSLDFMAEYKYANVGELKKAIEHDLEKLQKEQNENKFKERIQAFQAYIRPSDVVERIQATSSNASSNADAMQSFESVREEEKPGEDWLTCRLKDFKKYYSDPRAFISEFFTFIFFECPTHLLLTHPEATTETLLKTLSDYFPQSYAWHANQDMLRAEMSSKPVAIDQIMPI